MKFRPGAVAVGIAMISAGPAEAHHSFAMFDTKKEVTINGTVKEFRWSNPHIWIDLLVTDPTTGADVEWSIEGPAISSMVRMGWSKLSLQPGDKVTLVASPLRNGNPGGNLQRAYIGGKMIGHDPIGLPKTPPADTDKQ